MKKLGLSALYLVGAAAGGAAVMSFDMATGNRLGQNEQTEVARASPASSGFETAPRTSLLKPTISSDEAIADDETAVGTPPQLVAGPIRATRPADRFGYVPFRELALLYPHDAKVPSTEDILKDDVSEDETVDGWVARTEPTQPGPRTSTSKAASTKSEALPWAKPKRTAKKIWDKRLAERLAEISPQATLRLARKFESAGIAYPPESMTLVAIKDEKAVELHVRGQDGKSRFVHRYPVLAASGGSGPKLRRGDKQVPEGIYRITYLNPDSKYHVSLRVSYPNTFDRAMAKKDGREKLGGDIMVHGKAVSAGCLAVGDPAAEELFVLAAEVGIENTKLVIAPTDFRRRGVPDTVPGQPGWVPGLYTQVASAMKPYQRPQSFGLLSFFGN